MGVEMLRCAQHDRAVLLLRHRPPTSRHPPFRPPCGVWPRNDRFLIPHSHPDAPSLRRIDTRIFGKIGIIRPYTGTWLERLVGDSDGACPGIING